VRILLVSWEYPPIVVGGLGRHVYALSRELAAQGHDVLVVTRGESSSAVTERHDGVRVLRAARDPLALDFSTETLLSWAQASEHALLRAALPALRRWRPDVIHAHDWLVAQTAVTLSEITSARLVTTIHATEAGRNLGWLPAPLNTAIHSVERWLIERSQAVITCSAAMRTEVTDLFGAVDRITVVPNGIDVDTWRVSAAARRAARRRYRGDAALLAYAGRLVHEKGVQDLLDALPTLRRRHPGLRLVVAGTGVHESELQAHARRRRLGNAVQWLGFVPEPELATILAAADVVVVPSHYEPFGIVALEAAAVRTPLVVAATGGLQDLVDAGMVAGSFPPGDVAGLTNAVHATLTCAEDTRRAVNRGARVIRRDYAWPVVAERTAHVYRAASSLSSGSVDPS
jgi:glycogen(starch) synthase